jgi:hypothetical protein
VKKREEFFEELWLASWSKVVIADVEAIMGFFVDFYGASSICLNFKAKA